MTNNTVNEIERMVVTRVFDAPRELVWRALMLPPVQVKLPGSRLVEFLLVWIL